MNKQTKTTAQEGVSAGEILNKHLLAEVEANGIVSRYDGTIIAAMKEYASLKASTPQGNDGWVKEKPEKECAFISANKIKDVWEYQFWQIIEIMDGGGYFALCEQDGEEWGALEDLSSELYYIIPSHETIL